MILARSGWTGPRPRNISPSGAVRTPASAHRWRGREVAISVERLLARLGNIRISEEHHGPPDNRRFEYATNPVLRVMKGLHLEFDRI